ncbi:MAG: SDR family NAD(P)-dependent oxidoreductase [Proteobacteria bacterium]|jgi:short-subunit dehydrogenase|nr:SDR family NAD(P)-dependent oxidoreductase [Pseudomonadota bacterium]MDC0376023.1 SDR family NAD(P)-dependent oxidoreductase [Pelagibacteraceae bacterium]
MNILIIGATFGIGNALAEKYSDQCENLVLLGRTEARLAQLQKDFANKKARILTEILDVTQEEDCQKKLTSLIEKISKLDKVIYCSGYYEPDKTFEINLKLFKKTMDINFIGLINVCSVILPLFQKQRSGHLAVVSSLAGFGGLPNSSSYGPSKAAMMNYIESIKIDCDKFNIKTSIINPGFVKSRLTEKNTFDMPFLMSADKAADIIVDGLKKEKYEITFPLPMKILFKILRILPRNIYFKIVKLITKS